MTRDFEKVADLRNPVKITGQRRFGRISNRITIKALNAATTILRAITSLVWKIQRRHP